MFRRRFLPVALVLPLLGGVALADSLWERRDPANAYLFMDNRARNVGDVLTIVVSENTEFEGSDTRNSNKETKTSTGLSVKGNYGVGKLTTRDFTGDFTGSGNSQRKLDSQANNTIDHKFADRMTVLVVGVLPNGNLIVEGYRKRVVRSEARTLRVTGIVRPADIGAYNTIQSQYIADFQVIYDGRGPESDATGRGWFGKAVNKLWPF